MTSVTVTMPPAAFLLAAHTMSDTAEFPLRQHMRGLRQHLKKNPGVLKKKATLTITKNTRGEFAVVNHDGRHRAYLKMKRGDETIPVELDISNAPRPRKHPRTITVREECRDKPRYALRLKFAPGKKVTYVDTTESGEPLAVGKLPDAVQSLLRER
ncbi:MAG: hypothetical protein CL902_00465, partial [Dehalococcoidia bacterium]|nr:hypothetical protein [Dehalococcoidia bacterium]